MTGHLTDVIDIVLCFVEVALTLSNVSMMYQTMRKPNDIIVQIGNTE
jgi:hypothetical protein